VFAGVAGSFGAEAPGTSLIAQPNLFQGGHLTLVGGSGSFLVANVDEFHAGLCQSPGMVIMEQF
jgi:hypothetical protein